MNEQRIENARKFDEFLNDKELSTLSKDEQGEPSARRVEFKLNEESPSDEVCII